MDAPRTDELHAADVWLCLLVVAAAVLATEDWGTAGAVAAATAAATVATVRADAAPWPVSLAALCTSGAAAIHFAVVVEHLREWWGFGIFFLASGWLQLAWSALAPRSADRRLLWAGLVGNLAVVAIWTASRTTGLPFGPDSGNAESVSAPDLVATVFETVAAIGCAAALAYSTAAVRSARSLLAAVVGGVTAYALIVAAGAHV